MKKKEEKNETATRVSGETNGEVAKRVLHYFSTTYSGIRLTPSPNGFTFPCTCLVFSTCLYFLFSLFWFVFFFVFSNHYHRWKNSLSGLRGEGGSLLAPGSKFFIPLARAAASSSRNPREFSSLLRAVSYSLPTIFLRRPPSPPRRYSSSSSFPGVGSFEKPEKSHMYRYEHHRLRPESSCFPPRISRPRNCRFRKVFPARETFVLGVFLAITLVLLSSSLSPLAASCFNFFFCRRSRSDLKFLFFLMLFLHFYTDLKNGTSKVSQTLGSEWNKLALGAVLRL